MKQTLWARGYMDDGNWFEGSIQTPTGSRGTLSFPLSCLPEELQEQAKRQDPVWIKLTIEDDKKRVVEPESKSYAPATTPHEEVR